MKKNTDLASYMIENEPNTIVLIKKANLRDQPKTLTRDSTLKDPDNIQRSSSIRRPIEELKHLDTDISNVTMPKVTGDSNTEEDSKEE